MTVGDPLKIVETVRTVAPDGSVTEELAWSSGLARSSELPTGAGN